VPLKKLVDDEGQVGPTDFLQLVSHTHDRRRQQRAKMRIGPIGAGNIANGKGP
jgi:hypothetical protein